MGQWVKSPGECTKIDQTCPWLIYLQTSNICHTLVGNELVDHSDVVGAGPVCAAPTTFSSSTQHLDSMNWAKTTAMRDAPESFKFWELVQLILEIYSNHNTVTCFLVHVVWIDLPNLTHWSLGDLVVQRCNLRTPVLQNKLTSTFREFALRWMPQNDK